MSSELPKNRKFISTVNKFYKNNKESVLDIVLFGSSTKGKKVPNDIDILLLFKDTEDTDIAYELRKILKIFGKVQITTKTYSNMFDNKFMARESYLSEGYSLIMKKRISSGLGYSSRTVFKYKLQGFNQSRRMQLQYALYGRGGKTGIVKEFGLEKFADTVFFCQTEKTEKFREFLDYWEIEYDVFPILLPKRMV
ncbi:nucleotidyltransferase domain-containing protein [Candidatus Woesearchaeota archaeon]|nr:nucleotidyltransferase domain-containing protein [Candidatus Woesearchaeota archaeon]